LESALLAAAKMPLLEVFIGEFLLAVEQVAKPKRFHGNRW